MAVFARAAGLSKLAGIAGDSLLAAPPTAAGLLLGEFRRERRIVGLEPRARFLHGTTRAAVSSLAAWTNLMSASASCRAAWSSKASIAVANVHGPSSGRKSSPYRSRSSTGQSRSDQNPASQQS